MEPATTAALIKGGSALLGGFLGRSKRSSLDKEQAHASWKLTNQAFAQNATLFNERNHRIRLAARDAKNAGLHPLFALGSGLGSSGYAPSPGIPTGDQSQSGSFLGDAIGAAGDVAAELVNPQGGTTPVERSVIARNEAEAELLRAQKAKLTQEANARGAVTTAGTEFGPTRVWAAKNVRVDPVIHAPDQGVIHSKGGGTRPFWSEETWGEGGPIATMAYPYVEVIAQTLRELFGADNFARPSVTNPRAYYHYWKQRAKQ